jgi:hypothetical protein
MAIMSFLKKSSRLKIWRISLDKDKTCHLPEVDLVISCKGIWIIQNPKGQGVLLLGQTLSVELVIGAPGLPNVKKSVELGDAILYQTPEFGVIEIRVAEIRPSRARLMVSVVSPRSGFAAAYENDNIGNAHFASDESSKIEKAVDSVAQQMQARNDISPEQLAFLKEKLVEIAEASKRLGRKDWIMFVAGTMTNVVIGAAFAPEAAKALFSALNAELL